MSTLGESDRELVRDEREDKFSVILPCSQDEFGAFVSSLLGKPQTIEKVLEVTFEINRDHIETVFHLVSQRIAQQNTATLIQSSTKIVYEDSSSVVLNSFQDFV